MPRSGRRAPEPCRTLATFEYSSPCMNALTSTLLAQQTQTDVVFVELADADV
jgi:hypothetical protein